MSQSDIEFFEKLKKAYSDENLNRIAGILIELYQLKQFGQMRQLANRIAEYVVIDDESDAKCFSKLMMLYHPDRGEYYRNTIQSLFEKGRKNQLEEYSHILLLEKLDFNALVEIDDDIEYNPEYYWDEPKTGFNYYSENNEKFADEYDSDFEPSFYNAVKIRMYGNVDTEFPSYYLEDIDDIEYAECQIEELDGIENCIHAIVLNLSRNQISDISALWDLSQLEELYLANNHIGYIDSLSNLMKLKIVDLSYNEIDDISPLFNLEELEYVNVMGNYVPDEQLNKLKEMGVLVMS